MSRITRVYAALLIMLVLITAACNLTRATPTLPPTVSLPSNTPLRPPGTFSPSITPLDLSTPTPGGIVCAARPTNWIAYQVESGDSLGALAEATGTTIDALMTANCITNANSITVGQTIYLPTDPVVG